MKERDVTRDIRASFEEAGAWCYKIPDAQIPPTSTGFRRMPLPRPFDLVGCYQGRLLAIEVKLLRGYQAFGLRHLRESQVEHLDAIERAGGAGFIFCVVWVPREFKRLLIWHWSDFPRENPIRKKALEQLPYLQGAKQRFPLRQWLHNLDRRVP